MNMNEHCFFQIKMIRKETKPPVWRRAYVPSDITFAQMAILLMELLEIVPNPIYEFEFYQKKDRIVDRENLAVPDYYYDYYLASDTFVNEWFEQEAWFTFRIMDPGDGYPDYRIEIEKKLSIEKENEGKKSSLSHPLLIKGVVYGTDPFWHDGDQINRILEERYQITYGKAQYKTALAIQEDINRDHVGLIACKKPKNRNALLKESPYSTLRKTVDRFFNTQNAKSSGSFGERPGEAGSRHPKMQEYLKTSSIQDLQDYAAEYGLTISGKRKDKIVFELCRQMLTADKMKEVLLEGDEEELDAFEAALEKGCFLPEDEEAEQLELFLELGYLTEYRDGYMEIPEEVRTIYSTIQKAGYREYHKKACWLISCLTMLNIMLVVAPEKILYQMYQQRKEFRCDYRDFRKLLTSLPGKANPCVLRDDLVIAGSAVKDNIYKDIQTYQRNVPYYVPTTEDIDAFLEDFYPSNENAYQQLYAFYKEMKIPEHVCWQLCIQAYHVFSHGGMLSDYMDIVNDLEVVFPTQKAGEKFARIVMEVNNHTRMYELRGHKPLEMQQYFKSSPPGSGERPTIIPMSSKASELMAEGKDEIEKMGFRIDTESSASTIPVLNYPNGIKGTPVVAEKKIYPNDPCPCGSGKKYKKCCGRK